uniref:RagB/SusD family nutrient uptake outer membrane protein n=1 Tax=Prevotella sp. TaxID=59823 RepID=UPI0040258944
MKKKTNHIIKSLAVAFLGGLSLCSCTDFLTIYPTDKTVGENFWKNKDQVDQMVTGAYTGMISGSNIERFIIWGDYRSDVMRKTSALNNTTLDNITNVDLYPSSGYNSWSSFYYVINTCNLVMNHAQDVLAVDPDYTEGDYQTTRAQMLGLRALCHFYLVRTFRDVPYVTKAYEKSDDLTLDGQLAPDSTLQLCINDLVEAERGCYKYGTFAADDWRSVGLLSKDAINAILADVYLWRASLWSKTDKEKAKTYYQACIDYADKVIESHKRFYENNYKGSASSDNATAPYYLLSGNQAFYKNFVEGNSRESIFELQFDGTTNENNLVRQYFYKHLNTTSTYGMLAGTIAVGNTLGDEPTPSTQSASTSALYQSANDYRYYDNSYGVNIGNASSFEIRKMVYNQATTSSIPTNKQGYTYKQTRGFDNYKQNWIMYRITDVMLMKAEAETQLAGTDANKLKHAFLIVNAVNKRSLDPLAVNKDSLVYKDNYDKQAKLELLCLQERGRELLYEGKRWYDLVRYSYRHMTGVDPTKTLYEIDPKGSLYPTLDDADNEFKNILNAKYSTNILKFKNEAFLYWPILQQETKNNKLIHQNPVYVETQTSERQD